MKKQLLGALILLIWLAFFAVFPGGNTVTLLEPPFAGPVLLAAELSQPQARTAPVPRRQVYDLSRVDFTGKTEAADDHLNMTLGSALAKAMDAAGNVAKTAGQSVGNYIQTKQFEKRQQEVLEMFYRNYLSYESSYTLSPKQQDELLRRVEDIYIQESLSESPQVDLIDFTDMRQAVKKVYADMMKGDARDGTFKTYYLSGQVESTVNYENGELEGTAVFNAQDGSLLYIDTYHKGFRLNRKKYDAEGKLEFSQDYPSPYDTAIESVSSQSEDNQNIALENLKNDNLGS
ncbi:MAG: hypothetical protein H6757_00360 [Candidatus Omnitrophica bacterium]|nr:hypothetical protein [Candidatus Omnitrophota bacterium]